MARIKSKALYDLVKSLNKNEKRYFKVMASYSTDAEDKKMILLFDYINGLGKFEDENVLDKVPHLKVSQLSNLKAYLFDKILEALRAYETSKVKDFQIRKQIDFGQILFERRMYAQGKKCLDRAKKMSQASQNLEMQLEILKMEKSIMMQTLDDDVQHVDAIIAEVNNLSRQINNINVFSNLNIKLNSFYTRIGFIRDEQDSIRVRDFFNSNISVYEEEKLSVVEKLYLYRLYVGYYFFLQDFSNGYNYAKKLEYTFEQNESTIENNSEDYIKSLNNLLIAQNKLFRYYEFVETNKKLQEVVNLPSIRVNENIRIRLLKYFYIHEINKFFMTGEFDIGVEFIVHEKGGEIHDLMEVLDRHSALVMNYKIACLYFGAGNFGQAVKTLNKIISSSSTDLREDLHCFARILNLVCHYELGNFDVIKHYVISTYRFLLKKDDLRLFQKFILKFLKNLTDDTTNKELLERFQKLKLQLLPLVDSAYEKRAFIYFDIISWLESKIEKVPVQQIVMEKFKSRIDKAMENS